MFGTFVLENAHTARLLLKPTPSSELRARPPDTAGLLVVYGFRSGHHRGTFGWSLCPHGKIIQGG